MHTWQLQEAKAKMSEFLRESKKEGPQFVTVRGHVEAVLLSIEDYEKLVKKKKVDLYTFIRRSPLMGSDLEIERDQSLTREIDV